MMTCVLGRNLASWDGDRERPRTPPRDACCDGASGTLARVPGRSGRPETGWRVPGRCGRPGTAREAFRTGEASQDGARRPGTGGASGTPMHPSRVALIRAPGFAVRNGMKHVPGRAGRPGTVAGVPGRLERPGTANERPGTVRASRDGRGRPGTLRLTSVPRRSWAVLGRRKRPGTVWRASRDGREPERPGTAGGVPGR